MPKAYSRTIWLTDSIRLPNGQQFPIQELTNRVTNLKSINLRSHVQQRRRYTQQEREWIAGLSLQQIQQHFVCTPESAKNLLSASRRIVNDLYATPNSCTTQSNETHPDHG